MAVEDALASHAPAKPDAIATPADKSSDAAVRESGQEPKTKVFISYSRKDGNFVRSLNDALAAVQREVWVDWEDIPASAEWLAEIEGAIEGAQAFVFVLSPDSVTSEVCAIESVARRTTMKSNGTIRNIEHIRINDLFDM